MLLVLTETSVGLIMKTSYIVSWSRFVFVRTWRLTVWKQALVRCTNVKTGSTPFVWCHCCIAWNLVLAAKWPVQQTATSSTSSTSSHSSWPRDMDVNPFSLSPLYFTIMLCFDIVDLVSAEHATSSKPFRRWLSNASKSGKWHVEGIAGTCCDFIHVQRHNATLYTREARGQTHGDFVHVVRGQWTNSLWLCTHTHGRKPGEDKLIVILYM